MTTPTAPAITITADTLRFVRLCHDLSRAIAQRDAALAKLPRKEAYALQARNPAIAECARETLAAWTFRAGELGAVAPAVAPAVVAKVAPVPVPVSVVRDCRVRAMRRFMAVSREAGLNLKEVEAMKAALSKYLGRPVPSRRDLSAGQWCELTEGVTFGLVAW